MNPAITAEILKNYTESIILSNPEPRKEKYLKRVPSVNYSRYGVTTKEKSLGEYYTELINDTLRQIRKGKTAYLFRLVQVRDVLLYEPRARFAVYDGIISVNLNLVNQD